MKPYGKKSHKGKAKESSPATKNGSYIGAISISRYSMGKELYRDGEVD